MSVAPVDWPVHRVYGVTLVSDFPFRTPLIPAVDRDPPPDVVFHRRSEAPADTPEWRDADPVFTSALRLDSGEPALKLYRAEGVDVLHYEGVADFFLRPDRIDCHQLSPDADPSVELYLLGLVLCYWLERRGTRVLHASAAAVGDSGAVFLATAEGGKTSLAVTLMLAGHPMLTDDFLALEERDGAILGHSGFPQLRMWPDLAAHFLGPAGDLPRVVPGSDKRRVTIGPGGLGQFRRKPCRLARLYLPARRSPGDPDTSVRLEAVSPRDAVIELIRESFLTTLLERAGLHEARFHFFVRAAERVPMIRISFPHGLEHLPRVRDAVLRDLAAEVPT